MENILKLYIFVCLFFIFFVIFLFIIYKRGYSM